MDVVDWLLGMLSQHTETWVPRCGTTRKRNGVELVHELPGLTEDLIELQKRWIEAMDYRSLLDFTTLQHRFLERQERVRPHVDHVFVDEFQDTNPAQYALHTAWLEPPATRLTVVGDDDQALYRFRGSDIACFQGLRDDCLSRGIAFRDEILDINYRGTPEITEFAQAFRTSTALARVTMKKDLRPPSDARVANRSGCSEAPGTRCVHTSLRRSPASNRDKARPRPPAPRRLRCCSSPPARRATRRPCRYARSWRRAR